MNSSWNRSIGNKYVYIYKINGRMMNAPIFNIQRLHDESIRMQGKEHDGSIHSTHDLSTFFDNMSDKHLYMTSEYIDTYLLERSGSPKVIDEFTITGECCEFDDKNNTAKITNLKLEDKYEGKNVIIRHLIIPTTVNKNIKEWETIERPKDYTITKINNIFNNLFIELLDFRYSEITKISSGTFEMANIDKIFFGEKLSELEDGWNEHASIKRIDILPNNSIFVIIEDTLVVKKSDINKQEYDEIVFANLQNWKNIKIFDFIKTIRPFAFSNAKINTLTFGNTTNSLKIMDYAFESAKINTLAFGNTTNSLKIMDYAFSNAEIKIIDGNSNKIKELYKKVYNFKLNFGKLQFITSEQESILNMFESINSVDLQQFGISSNESSIPLPTLSTDQNSILDALLVLKFGVFETEENIFNALCAINNKNISITQQQRIVLIYLNSRIGCMTELLKKLNDGYKITFSESQQKIFGALTLSSVLRRPILNRQDEVLTALYTLGNVKRVDASKARIFEISLTPEQNKRLNDKSMFQLMLTKSQKDIIEYLVLNKAICISNVSLMLDLFDMLKLLTYCSIPLSKNQEMILDTLKSMKRLSTKEEIINNLLLLSQLDKSTKEIIENGKEIPLTGEQQAYLFLINESLKNGILAKLMPCDKILLYDIYIRRTIPISELLEDVLILFRILRIPLTEEQITLINQNKMFTPTISLTCNQQEMFEELKKLKDNKSFVSSFLISNNEKPIQITDYQRDALYALEILRSLKIELSEEQLKIIEAIRLLKSIPLGTKEFDELLRAINILCTMNKPLTKEQKMIIKLSEISNLATSTSQLTGKYMALKTLVKLQIALTKEQKNILNGLIENKIIPEVETKEVEGKEEC